MSQIKKETWVEVLRILAIFLVVSHHVTSLFFKGRDLEFLSSSFVSLVFSLSSVSVPLFFLISGYLLLEKKDGKDKYWSRIRRLLIPLLVWSLIYSLYPYQSNYYNRLHDPKLMVDSLKLMWFTVTKKGYHLWFLYTLTGIYFMLPILRAFIKSIDQNLMKFFLLGWFANNGIIFLNIWLSKKYSFNIGWQVGLNFFFIYFGYFLLGKLLVKHNNLLFQVKIFFMIAIFCSFTLLLWSIFWHEQIIDFYPINDKNPLIMVLSLSTFIIFYLTHDHEIYSNQQVKNIISFFSSITYSVYLIHVICLDIVMLTLEKFVIIRDNLYLWLPIVILFTYVFSVLMSFLGKMITLKLKYNQYLFP